MKIERGQVELDKPIKALGAHKIKIHLHPEVSVDITAVVARSPDEAEFLVKGGTLVAETERAQLEAAEAARRAAEQAAALFEAKPADGEATEAPAPTEEAEGRRQEISRVPQGARRPPTHAIAPRWRAFSFGVIGSRYSDRTQFA